MEGRVISCFRSESTNTLNCRIFWADLYFFLLLCNNILEYFFLQPFYACLFACFFQILSQQYQWDNRYVDDIRIFSQ